MPHCRPFTGAWIETSRWPRLKRRCIVAPSRGRGSKRRGSRRRSALSRSPLHGGVDRNLSCKGRRSLTRRRPFTGAWIETCLTPCRLRASSVAPSRGRGSKHEIHSSRITHPRSPLHGGVDRNFTCRLPPSTSPCRPFTGAWIETILLISATATSLSPLHGGVDRNEVFVALDGNNRRRPFTGAWIETVELVTVPCGSVVAPSRGRGSKPMQINYRFDPLRRPFTGAWIETRW